jgi:preprotein translocase subunit SecF
MLNIIGKRYWFFALSLAIIIPGMIILAIKGLPFSIDFRGGNRLEVQFTEGKVPENARVFSLFQSLGVGDAQVVTSGTNALVINYPPTEEDIQPKVLSGLQELSGDKVIVLQSDNVGPTIGQEVTSRALLTLLITCAILIIFITFSFRGVEHAWHYGIATVVATIHDVLVIFSVMAIGSLFWNWQFDTLFLTALLTVIAFSSQDTIVVFDRLRENSGIYRKLDYEKLTNHSVVQTLSRSINTQLMTVDFLLLALALFGGVTLRQFAAVLIVGMISGSYSSIFIAAPVLVVWEKKEWRNWFRRSPAKAQA